MNKPLQMLTLAALLAAAQTAMAQTDIKATTPGYWASTNGNVVVDPFGLCWHTGYFTPDMAQIECDPDLMKVVQTPAVVPTPPADVKKPPVIDNVKITFAADAFFDFDKSTLKPEGKAALDDLVGKLHGVNLEVIIAVGYTDSIGSDAYNQKLSVRRADSVKAYLISKGIEPNRIYTEGKGKTKPVAPNTINGKDNPAGRAKNRRVEIEVVGTRAAQ